MSTSTSFFMRWDDGMNAHDSEEHDDEVNDMPSFQHGSGGKGERVIRRRSFKACDNCRKLKCKCDRTGDNQPCRHCVVLGTECTFLGPSRTRGPPKGYIDALESRRHALEALREMITSANGPRSELHVASQHALDIPVDGSTLALFAASNESQDYLASRIVANGRTRQSAFLQLPVDLASSAPAYADPVITGTDSPALLSASVAAERSLASLCNADFSGSSEAPYLRTPPTPKKLDTALSMIKELLTATRDASDMFLPLKAALVGLLKVWDVCERTVEIQQTFIELANKLAVLGNIATQYQRLSDTHLQIRLEAIASALDQFVEAIAAKRKRTWFGRATQSLGDLAVIDKLFRRLSSLLEVFQFESQVRAESLLVTVLQRLHTAEQRQMTTMNAVNDILALVKEQHSSSSSCETHVSVSSLPGNTQQPQHSWFPSAHPYSPISASPPHAPLNLQSMASPHLLETASAMLKNGLSTVQLALNMFLPLKSTLVGSPKLWQVYEHSKHVWDDFLQLAHKLTAFENVTTAIDQLIEAATEEQSLPTPGAESPGNVTPENLISRPVVSLLEVS